MLRRSLTRRSLLAVSGTSAACAIGASLYGARFAPTGRDRTVIKFSHVVAEDTPKGKAANHFRDLLSQATNGEVTAAIYPNSTLYKDKEELEALHMGSVEMVAPSLAKLGPLGIKYFEIFDLPFLFDSYAALHKVTDGPVGAALMQRLNSTGLLGLAFWDNGFKQMSANRPLLLPADFRGLKMRIQESEVLEAQMRALGATPDQMALSDVYAALDAGVVDGTENPTSNFLTQRMNKVQRYMTLSNHGYLGYVVLVKERFWRDLPSEVREVVRSCLAKATAYANEIAKSENDAALVKIRQAGTTVLMELPPANREMWKAALASTHSEFRRRMGSDLIDAVYATMQTRPLA